MNNVVRRWTSDRAERSRRWTYPPHSLGLLFRQLNDRLSRRSSSSEISFLEFALLVIPSQEVVERLGVLVDQLGELRVVGSDLLDQGLDHRWILDHELWGAIT
jgi:hypothetical protein